MIPDKADIIARLQKEILPLEGYKPVSNSLNEIAGLGAINHAFPNKEFPLGAVHEFLCDGAHNKAVTSGFVSGILSALMKRGGNCIWIGREQTIFPPALKTFGIDPERMVFIAAQKEKEILWLIEEALKCDVVAGVVGEVRDLGFTASRRLQLAVEQSQVTGFLLRDSTRNNNTTACVARWQIDPLPSALGGNIPGLGFPRWNVKLLKVRNGKTGSWQIEWKEGRFRHVPALRIITEEEQRKVG